VYTITITAIDASGNTTTATQTVIVAHDISSPKSGAAVKVGSIVNFTGTFWDVPGNRHTAKWLIDGKTTVNGLVTEPVGLKNGTVTGSYMFTSPGVYKLQMNVIDQKGVVTYANTNGDLEAIVVIYDPNGGYTYGGGYFASPAGALKNNLAASGDVSYGYTVNYYKGATLPKGEMQFEFKSANIEFNAINFDYLIISGARAQFRGSGKIIGDQSGYAFIMTVIDGALDGTGVDKVRMKIFNKNTGAIIYDNQPGSSDAANPSIAVGLNSSVVVQNTIATVAGRSGDITESTPLANELHASAIPNPSNNSFTLYIRSDNLNDIITMQVIDLYGRIIEKRITTANSAIKLGDKYGAGVYMVIIRQGENQKQLQLVKTSGIIH